MRRLTESELLFLGLVVLSTLSLVPAAFSIYDKHRTAALVTLGGALVVLLAVFFILWRGRPRHIPL